MLSLLFVLTLIRYRAVIPLMYLLIVVDYLGHRGIGIMKPIARVASSSGSYVSTTLMVLSITGLVLSLRGKNYSA